MDIHFYEAMFVAAFFANVLLLTLVIVLIRSRRVQDFPIHTMMESVAYLLENKELTNIEIREELHIWNDAYNEIYKEKLDEQD